MESIRDRITSLYPQLEFVESKVCDTDVKWELVFKLNNVPHTSCVISYWKAGYRIDYRKQYSNDVYGKVYDVWNASNGFLPSISFLYDTLDNLL